MRLLVDTNVWLAGRFGRGLCADLLDTLIVESAEILLDERVHGEFHRVARDKFGVDAETLAASDVFFQRYTQIIPASDHSITGIPDPDDAWIIATALSANAELFVTGDKALLALEQVDQLPIVDPRTVYMRLRGLG